MRIGLIIAVLAGVSLTGCATASRQGAATAAGPKAALALDDYSPAAVEHRTEAHARFATAFLHDLNDEHRKAAEEYVKAGLADLHNEELLLEITSRLLRFKQNDKAIELLTKATAEPRASGVLFAQLGLAYSLAGQRDRAIEANRMAIQKLPRSLVGYRHLAQIYLQEGKPEAGLEVLDRAAKQPDADAAFLTELGEFYLAFAKTSPTDVAKERAKAAFNRAVQQKPEHPFLLQKLADGFLFLGETDQAVGLYSKLLTRFPHLPGLREKLAELYLRKQDKERAAEHLRAVIHGNPTNPQAHYLLGTLAYEDGNLQEAVESFRRVKLLNPNFEPAYYDLAAALINRNQPLEALDVLEEARGRFKPNFICEFFTAMAYNRQKDYAKAIKYFTAAEVVARVTDTNRLNHLFYFQLGAAYERNRQFDEAEKCFKQCLEKSADFSEALNYLGYMWADQGVNLEEAHQLIEKAVRLEPNNAAYLDSLGWVLFKLNKPQEALPYLLKAIEYAEGAPPFTPADFKDLPALVDKLRRGADPVSEFLHQQFSAENRRLLAKSTGPGTNASPAKSAVVEEFNRLLQGPCLHTPDRFAKIELPPDIQRLLEQNPQGEALLRLNRRLLEAAFPRELARSHFEEPDPVLHDHLGDVYLALQEQEKARAAWRKALAIEPNEYKEKIQQKLDALMAGQSPPSPAAPK